NLICNRSTVICSAGAVSCNWITIIPNICRSFHGTCLSASLKETRAGTRWFHRPSPRSSGAAVSSVTRNIDACRPPAPHAIDSTDVVFRIWLKYACGADEGVLPIGKVCLSGKTAVTWVGLYPHVCQAGTWRRRHLA